MSFKYPLFLLLLLVVPVLVYLRYASRRRPPLPFSTSEALRRLAPSWAVWAWWILPALYVLGLTLLIVAIARPRLGLKESTVHTEAVDIVLLVDVSTSMRAEDFSTAARRINRLDAAKDVIREFIEKRPNDRIGMVAFSAMPYTAAPLTLDHGWLLQRMDDLKTGMLEDGTAIGDAIASAINRLRDSEAKSKVVILLTDGVNNAGTLSPENAAQAAKAMDVKVYTVGAGSTGPVPIPVQDPFGGTHYVRQIAEIDEVTLKHISRTTGAMYFRADDLKSLGNVYDQIDEMEKTEIDVEQYTRFEEKFSYFALWALILLAVERFLALTRLGRLPQ